MVGLRHLHGILFVSLYWTSILLEPDPNAAAAQSAPDSSAKTNAERLDAMKSIASRYELTTLPEGDVPRELQCTVDPVQRWTNPIRQQGDGCLYLWTLEGRPQAALSIYPSLDGAGWKHEFQSLAETPLMARLDGEAVWTPELAGVEFNLLPDAPPPAAAASRRLLQVRSLARRFAATVDVRGDRSELRLLPAPVYTCSALQHTPLDRAVFLFAHGTDPELILMLEARPAQGHLRWHYALARLTLWPLEARYQSETVWSAEKWIRRQSNPKQAYYDREYRDQ